MVVVEKNAFEKLLVSAASLEEILEILCKGLKENMEKEKIDSLIEKTKQPDSIIRSFDGHFRNSIKYLNKEDHILEQIVAIFHNKKMEKEVKEFRGLIQSLVIQTTRVENDIRKLRFYTPDSASRDFARIWLESTQEFIKDLENFQTIARKLAQKTFEFQKDLKNELEFLGVLDGQDDVFVNNFISWLLPLKK